MVSNISHQDWKYIVWKKNVQPVNVPKKMIVSDKQKNANSINNTIKKIYNEEDDIKYKSVEPDILPILIDKEFSKKLQVKRIEQKLSQQDLANKLSIPVTIINQYEKGTGIRNGLYVSKIKKFLNI
jgi:ribosome-binding protein aMBF1 (putative translation factor)